jgi:hypothetical protein
MKQNISMGFAIVVILIVVIVFGGLMWMAGRGNDRSDSESIAVSKSQEAPQSKVEESEEVQLPRETEDWQTYSNETYGFSMKYPKGWTVKDDIQACPRPDSLDPTLYPAGSGICSVTFASFPGYDPASGMDRTPEQWPKDGFVVTASVGYNPQKLSTEAYLGRDKDAVAQTKQTFVVKKNAFLGFKGGVRDGNYFGPYYSVQEASATPVSFEISGAFGGGKPSDEQLKKYSDLLREMLATWSVDSRQGSGS